MTITEKKEHKKRKDSDINYKKENVLKVREGAVQRI
jgi:hypothetical protein